MAFPATSAAHGRQAEPPMNRLDQIFGNTGPVRRVKRFPHELWSYDMVVAIPGRRCAPPTRGVVFERAASLPAARAVVVHP